MNELSTATQILKTLIDNKYEAYFVGGCVRDKLLGQIITDIDITTSATPEEVQRLFPKTLSVGAKFGVIIVQKDGYQFEVATFRNDGAYIDGRRPLTVEFSTAEEDVNRRDFTINGLLFDPIANKIIDFVGGQKDLQNKTIRAIGDPLQRFQEDHLRMLRAIRFSARLDFELEPKTKDAIFKLKAKIRDISRERVTNELQKMLQCDSARKAIDLLCETKLIDEIFHKESNTFLYLPIFFETIKTINFHSFLWAIINPQSKNQKFNILNTIKNNLNDLQQKTLSLSNSDTKAIEYIHDNILLFTKFNTLTEPQKIRLHLAPMQKEALDLLEALVIFHSQTPVKASILMELTNLQSKFSYTCIPDAMLDGNEIMALGIKPGKILAEIKEELINQQLIKKIQNKDEAHKFVKNYLPNSI